MHIDLAPEERGSLTFAPQGTFGGQAGTTTRVTLNNQVLSDDPASMTNGVVTLEGAEDRLVLEFPSGAGAGEPSARPGDRVQRDVENGLVSDERARDEYGA